MLGAVGRCTHLPTVEILLQGDVICGELAPASHIKRTIKKLIVFGKSLAIYSMLARLLPGQLQAGLQAGCRGYSPTATHMQHPKMSGLSQDLKYN